MSYRPFRFGFQTGGSDAGAFRERVVRAEEAGFDVVHTADHLGAQLSPLVSLASAAGWTSKIRLCPLVLNNDLHHPATLAQELASLDHLSGGRLEVGIGAGHSFTEYEQMGLAFDPPAVRKARLGEAVEILRRLLAGEAVSFEGEHYRLSGLPGLKSLQAHVPILVGVNGRAALAHAALHADIVGTTMLGKTLADGHNHEVRWEPDRLEAAVAFVRQCAGSRFESLELNALVQAVTVTTERRQATADLVAEIPSLGLADALATPYLAIGTHDEIAEHLVACRQRFGISYYSVREIEAFQPVIERLRRVDAGA